MATTPSNTPGGVALRAYLEANGLNIPKFCDLHGLDRIQVQRIMSDPDRRVSVNLAHAIHIATHGTVSWDVWVTEPTARPSTAA